MRSFIGGLSEDREAILGSLDSISDLAVQTADLVTGIRPGLTKDIKELRTVAGNLNENRAEIDRALKVLPIKLEKVGRTAIYGSWFNFYICEFTGQGHPARRARTLPVKYSTNADEVQHRMSTPFRERNPVIIGAISLAVIAALMTIAFKAGDLPIIGGGDTYYANFSEAGGLKPNDEVRIAGVRVGKVRGVELDGDQVQRRVPGRRGRRVRPRDRRRDPGQDDARRDVPRARARRVRARWRRAARSPSSAPSRRTTSSRSSRGSPSAPSGSTPTSWRRASTRWPR